MQQEIDDFTILHPEFPPTINSQDAKGNILKMRVQLGVPKPEPLSNHSHDWSNGPVVA
jgi:hypothetical protein